MLINGQAADALAVQDRGLLYGDGVFETILCEGGRPILLAGHTQRLATSCARLHLPAQELPAILSDIRQVAGDDDCVVKVIVTRGIRERGYGYDKQDDRCTRIVYRDDVPEIPAHYYQTGIKLTQCQHVLPDNPPLAGLKHLNRLDQVIARSEWEQEFQEGLMLNAAGEVIEGTMTNLVIEKDQQWITPELDRAGVAGVMRQWILRNAYHVEKECVEGKLTLADVQQADAMFVCNSVIGVWPVATFADKDYAVSDSLRQLMTHINDNLSTLYRI